MTSRERVLTAFEHKEPNRVPCWCGSSAEFWAKAKRTLQLDDEGLRVRFGDDFRRVWPRYCGPEFKLSPGAQMRTPFGVERAGLGYGHATSHPLANATLKEVEAYPWPDPAWQDVSGIRAEALADHGQYAILGGDWSPFFHELIDLLGMEQMYYRMYDDPALIDALVKHSVDYYAECSRRIFDAAAGSIDIFFMGNDFGSQTGPLLSEALFRRFILPSLKRLTALGHDYKLKVMLHCCGAVYQLMPVFIEAGLDGLHAVQPSCRGMELARLKREFGHKLLFNGAIDSQHVLIEGTPQLVRGKTREVLEIMMPGGGYVAGASHDTILEETPVENVVAMFDAIAESGRYR